MSPPSTEHGFATQLRELLPLPRHAVFHVSLVIHELQSVPLVAGEFRIKWKFAGLQPVSSDGRPLGLARALASKMDGRHKRGHATCADEKGKGKARDAAWPPAEVEHDGAPGSTLRPASPHSVPSSTLRPASTHSVPSSTLRPASPHSVPSSTLRPASTHSVPSSTLRPASTHSVPSSLTSASTSKQSSSGSASASVSVCASPPGVDYLRAPRGHTPFLPLRDFKVAFEWPADAAVQMSVARDSHALLPSELKLTVMQRVVPHDPAAPQNPRLGHVALNLAEYAGAGPVTRTYLLRRSKVNAMLHMTLAVSHIAGEARFRAPPLRKEEIKAGIADFLSTRHTPLPAPRRFVPAEDPWLADSLGLVQPPGDDDDDEAPDEAAGGAADVPAREGGVKKRWRVGAARRAKTPERPTPRAGSGARRRETLHPTEALIEALFNPYPSTSPAPSPFTYYVPPGEAEPNGTSGEESYASSRHSASEVEPAGTGEAGGSRWWRRKGSRPVTPGGTSSTRSQTEHA